MATIPSLDRLQAQSIREMSAWKDSYNSFDRGAPQPSVRTFDDVTDPEMQSLIREGSSEELIRWLEARPAK